MVREGDFNKSVPLPPGLTITGIKKAIEYVERELADWVEIYFEQANVFSAIVGIFATRALDANTVYEKNRNVDLAQQRFPDLIKRGSGSRPSPEVAEDAKKEQEYGSFLCDSSAFSAVESFFQGL